MKQTTIKTQITTLYIESENKTIVRLVVQCQELGQVDELIIGWYFGEPNPKDTELMVLNFMTRR